MANGGSTTTSMARGQNIKESWGKDTSEYNGSQATERGKKLAGSTNNLSHSLSGASAQQHVD